MTGGQGDSGPKPGGDGPMRLALQEQTRKSRGGGGVEREETGELPVVCVILGKQAIDVARE